MSTEPVMFREGHGCRRFEGKQAVVTAGTAGIGLAICHRLLSEGCQALYLCSRKQANVDEAVAELSAKYGPNRVFGMACNVTKPGALEDFSVQVGKQFNHRVDVLVSNVGVNPSAGNSLDLSDVNYDKLFDANVKSHWKVIKLLQPMMTKPGGSIVLTSSVGGFSPAFPIGLYGVTKTALIALGRALATELGPQGIRINTLCPGLVKTKMAEMLWKDEENIKHYSSFLGRLGEPEDMAGTVAFLLSDDARHITGEAIIVSGGSQGRL